MFLLKTTYEGDTRRVSLEKLPTLNELRQLVLKLFPALSNSEFSLKYDDDDGDVVTIGSDGEIVEWINVARKSTFSNGEQPLLRMRVVKLGAAAGVKPEAKAAPQQQQQRQEIPFPFPVNVNIGDLQHLFGTLAEVVQTSANHPLAQAVQAQLCEQMKNLNLNSQEAKNSAFEELQKGMQKLAMGADPRSVIEQAVAHLQRMAQQGQQDCAQDSKQENSQDKAEEEGEGVHIGIICDGCEMNPLRGKRFKCTYCKDFDLCQKCEASEVHPQSHVMVMMNKPQARACQHQAKPEEAEVVHIGVRCDVCNAAPIRGIRFKCSECPDYDLCEQCESTGVHGHHNFLKFRTAQVPFQPRICRRIVKSHTAPNRSLARFVSDVTIPDGVVLQCGTGVLKIWRVRNEGKDTWAKGSVTLNYVGGDKLAQRISVPIEEDVAPGQEVDVAVDMEVPTKPGRYITYWRLAIDGTRFGQRMWMDIIAEEEENAANPVDEEQGSQMQEEQKPEEEQPAMVVVCEEIPKELAEEQDDKPKEDEKYKAELETLQNMGFTDPAILSLLQAYDGDVLSVIQELLRNQ